jgi:hypothetical protein
MSNPEIQDQWHRSHLIGQISCQLDVSTMLTSAFNHLLCFNLMRRVKKVSKLINHPVVCLFVTRVGGTRVKVIP